MRNAIVQCAVSAAVALAVYITLADRTAPVLGIQNQREAVASPYAVPDTAAVVSPAASPDAAVAVPDASVAAPEETASVDADITDAPPDASAEPVACSCTEDVAHLQRVVDFHSQLLGHMLSTPAHVDGDLTEGTEAGTLPDEYPPGW